MRASERARERERVREREIERKRETISFSGQHMQTTETPWPTLSIGCNESRHTRAAIPNPKIKLHIGIACLLLQKQACNTKVKLHIGIAYLLLLNCSHRAADETLEETAFVGTRNILKAQGQKLVPGSGKIFKIAQVTPCRESRRCSRDTCPESYITKHTSRAIAVNVGRVWS